MHTTHLLFALSLTPFAAASSSQMAAYAIESSDGVVWMSDNILFLAYDPTYSADQSIALNFPVSIPANAIITSANIQFHALTISQGAVTLRIYAEASVSPLVLSNAYWNVSTRYPTNSYQLWQPGNWMFTGTAQNTPDISNVLQELVSQPNWGNGTRNITLIVKRDSSDNSSNYRAADSGVINPTNVPLLLFTYTLGPNVTSIAAASWSEEQNSNLQPYLTSNTLQMTYDYTPGIGEQIIGLRFENISIPARSSVVYGYVQFTCSQISYTTPTLRIYGQRSPNSFIFYQHYADVSSRPLTTAYVIWKPNPWIAVGDSNMLEQTANLAPIIQELVALDGWTQQSPLVLVIKRDPSDTGIGSRWARDSYSGAMPSITVLYTNNFVSASVSPTPSVSAAAGVSTYTLSDHEEEEGGYVYKGTSDIKLTYDLVNSIEAIVALRFRNITIPSNAMINAVTLQFTAVEADTGLVSIRIWGEASSTPASFNASRYYDVQQRFKTKAYVDWQPPTWSMFQETSDAQRTPDLSPILQELVWQSSWVSGTTDVVLIIGRAPYDHTNNTRNAFSGGGFAPTLQVALTYNAVQMAQTGQSTWNEQDVATGLSYFASNNLQMTYDLGYGEQIIGIRTQLLLTASQQLLLSYVQFEVDQLSYDNITLRIFGEKAVNANAFSLSRVNDVSGRTRTNAYVDWVPDYWTVVGEHSFAEQTPDISPILQEIISQPGWVSGNQIVLIFVRAPVPQNINGSRWAMTGLAGEGNPFIQYVTLLPGSSYSLSTSRSASVTPSLSVSPSVTRSLSSSPAPIQKSSGSSNEEAKIAAAIIVSVGLSAALLLCYCVRRRRLYRSRALVETDRYL